MGIPQTEKRWSEDRTLDMHVGTTGAHDESLFVEGLDLANERGDFFRGEFAGELGHVSLAVGDDVAQIFAGSGGCFLGDERWPTKMTALGSLSMALGAIFLVDGA